MATSEDVVHKRAAACLRVACIAEADIPPSTTDESIRASKNAHIKQLLDTGEVKDWDAPPA